MKTCTKCGECKPEDDFYFKSKVLGDRYANCKKCHWIYYQKKQYMKNNLSPSFKLKKKVYLKAYQRIKKMRDRGLSLDEYSKLLNEQGNVCKICGKSETARGRDGSADPLSIDHCHKTNKVRGLLCRRCNTGLGCFDDSPDVLERVIKYLLDNA